MGFTCKIYAVYSYFLRLFISIVLDTPLYYVNWIIFKKFPYVKLILSLYLQKEQLEALKEKLYILESEKSELHYSNLKLQEENKQLAVQFTESYQEERPENIKSNLLEVEINERENKDSVGSDSPERFEIVDKNLPIFKQRGSIMTLEDNLSNNSFNANDWMNITIPQDSQTENKSKNIDLEIR